MKLEKVSALLHWEGLGPQWWIYFPEREGDCMEAWTRDGHGMHVDYALIVHHC